MSQETKEQVMALQPCRPHNFGSMIFSIFDKNARFRWTSRDPSNEHGYVGSSLLDLYPEGIRERAFEHISKWIMTGKSSSYIASVYDWPREVHDLVVSKKITLMPLDSGELAGAAFSTVLPENYRELADDDFTVLRLMAQDKPLKEIAHSMNRSKSAIDARIKSLKTKLGCQTIGGLVALAIQCALI